jgi:hypothetical protein
VFDQAAHNRRVNEFINLLQERQTMLRTVIPHLLYNARTFNAATTSGAVGNLRVELNSKRRGVRSVRSLLTKYPDLISSLTPCFLMSPDSVAKFLEPGTVTFDLVVFDEASQITVASAVGALGRSTAAIVVGDSRQMPPTSVAEAGSGAGEDDMTSGPDAEEDAVITDAESILDECLESGVTQEWLAWHYRSQDELLIKFSNDKYYEGRLSSFPSPWLDVPGCGIDYHRVNGQFDHGDKRTNEIEAAAIVAEVQRRANHPVLRNHSIGVVTLNMQQRELIDNKLRGLNDPAVTAALESDDDAENLFVLNLESVQGRERDVIVLGTSFSGRVGGGKMPLNFGPLTQKGGERRLNVAITRARRQVVVFSSFDPEELAGATALGTTHLYEYLKMAKAASDGQRPETTVPSAVSDDLHRSVVADALRARGLIVETGVGLSSFKIDLAVTLPGFERRWLVGVLLDGTVWASRPLALDRDALPTTVLQNLMGWRRIARVWLPSWRTHQAEVVEDIFDAAVAVSTEPDEPAAPHTPTTASAATPDSDPDPRPEPSHERLDESTEAPVISAHESGGFVFDNERPYVEPLTAETLGTVAELEGVSAKARSLFAAHVDQCGPMPLVAAIKLTAKSFGLSRVVNSRLDALARLADPATLVHTDFGSFVFPRDYVDDGVVSPAFTWFRRSTFAQRKLGDVAPHEMANLFRALANASYSIDKAELIDEAGTVLGYKRKGADTVELMAQLIDWSIDEGYLRVDDDRITAAAR